MISAQDEFDDEEAKKILINAKVLLDIGNAKITNRTDASLGKISVKEWLRQLEDRVGYSLSYELFVEIYSILVEINESNFFVFERIEELLRRVSLVADRRQVVIRDLEARVREKDKHIRDLQMLVGTFRGGVREVEQENVASPEVKDSDDEDDEVSDAQAEDAEFTKTLVPKFDDADRRIAAMIARNKLSRESEEKKKQGKYKK